ncbi:hypothetical protein H310_05333 [Aphanomyces invadans]|uniref:BZIP domain-containing protein n=1 Tax=Aphanomyces invadans TaxID=157072 RepID=A0A024U8X3_9STRA|nr:hypothetical protein H310_05333 [Aphanomyces invadans]ETW02856.1 hypothetical protein H310_05333 [Aphanomyces invadans]|eukprot:XP_008868240.1 hypothetical protein H310_05333 [Aphanomyces invadans]
MAGAAQGRKPTEEERLERRRLRCMINQRRYRANLRNAKTKWRNDMDELGRVNQRLERHLAAVEGSGLWCHAQEQSILEYFRLFEHGYNRTPRQDSFLRFWVAPDGHCNDQKGVEAVMSMWASYSDTFTSLHLACTRLIPVAWSLDSVIIEAHCSVTLGVSLAALQALFPHVISRQDLVDMMLGTPFLLPMHATYTFDRNMQVTRQTSGADVVGALLHQFGNLDDVAFAVSNAGIQSNAMLRVNVHTT